MPRKRDSKEEALRREGAFNSRANNILDPLFTEREFFDPRDLVQVKYELLRRVRLGGESVTKAVSAFGFSRPTYYLALKAFEQDGLAGLIPQKRGPRRAHKLTKEVMDFVDVCLSEAPDSTTAHLAAAMYEHFNISVHRRSIERSLQRRREKKTT